MCPFCGCDVHLDAESHTGARGHTRSLRTAAANRAWLDRQGATAVSLRGTPGSGKTSLIEATIARLGQQLPLSVLEADQAGDLDAQRIRHLGCDVFQVHTGTKNQLDPGMVGDGLLALKPGAGSLLLIENVGGLATPGTADVGEHARVVAISVPEGDDKPLKYPHAFRHVDALVITKLDLLGFVDFDLDACLEHALQVNPRLQVFGLSRTTGAGMDAWCEWLQLTVERRRHSQMFDEVLKSDEVLARTTEGPHQRLALTPD